MELYEKIALGMIAIAIMAATLFFPFKQCGASGCNLKKVEHYRDPIWMNKKKMIDDWYERSNGSIYGNYSQGYDMFQGYPVFPKAY